MVYAAQSGFWLTSNQVVGALVSFGLSILFAHFVSKEVFGIYKYILSIAGIGVALTLSGMNTAVTQAVAKGREGIFKKSLYVQLKWVLLSSAFSLAFSVYYFLHSNNAYGICFIIIAILYPLSSVANTYSGFLQGKKEFRTLASYGIFSSIFYFILVGTAAFYFPSVPYLILAYYAANAFTNIFFCIRTYQKYKPSPVYDPADIVYGKHLSFLNILGMIAAQLDSVILYYFLGPATLAIYTFAISIPERIRVLFSFISTAALPKLSENENSTMPANIWRKSIQLFIIAVVISIVYILIAPTAFHWLFPQYENSVLYSQVFSISLIAIMANISLSALFAKRLQKQLYIVGTVGPIVKIVIMFIAIYFYGLWGAIVAKILSHTFNTILPIILLKKSHEK